MTITVQLFARGRELVGMGTVIVELPAGTTVAELRRSLALRYPPLAPLLDHSAIAVNHDFADDARALSATDEVAIIPPVSGG